MNVTQYGRGSGRSFGGFGGRRSLGPKPVEEGKEYEVTITETSKRGDGVAKIDGFVVFVAGASVGSKQRIKVTRVSDRFANAEVVASSESGQSEQPQG